MTEHPGRILVVNKPSQIDNGLVKQSAEGGVVEVGVALRP
jgi:hypothetical protein